MRHIFSIGIAVSLSCLSSCGGKQSGSATKDDESDAQSDAASNSTCAQLDGANITYTCKRYKDGKPRDTALKLIVTCAASKLTTAKQTGTTLEYSNDGNVACSDKAGTLRCVALQDEVEDAYEFRFAAGKPNAATYKATDKLRFDDAVLAECTSSVVVPKAATPPPAPTGATAKTGPTGSTSPTGSPGSTGAPGETTEAAEVIGEPEGEGRPPEEIGGPEGAGTPADAQGDPATQGDPEVQGDPGAEGVPDPQSGDPATQPGEAEGNE